MDRDRAATASKAYSLAIFDDQAEDLLRAQMPYVEFKTKVALLRERVLDGCAHEWELVLGKKVENRLIIVMTCLPAARRALDDAADAWQLRCLDQAQHPTEGREKVVTDDGETEGPSKEGIEK